MPAKKFTPTPEQIQALRAGDKEVFRRPHQSLQLDFIAANTLEEKYGNLLQSHFNFWFAVHFLH